MDPGPAQYRSLPPFPAFPERFHGRNVLQFGCVWAGDLVRGERVLAPLRGFARPLFDLVGRRPYVAMQAANDKAVPHGRHYYWKSCEVTELGDAVALALKNRLDPENLFRMNQNVAPAARAAVA